MICALISVSAARLSAKQWIYLQARGNSGGKVKSTIGLREPSREKRLGNTGLRFDWRRDFSERLSRAVSMLSGTNKTSANLSTSLGGAVLLNIPGFMLPGRKQAEKSFFFQGSSIENVGNQKTRESWNQEDFYS